MLLDCLLDSFEGPQKPLEPDFGSTDSDEFRRRRDLERETMAYWRNMRLKQGGRFVEGRTQFEKMITR